MQTFEVARQVLREAFGRKWILAIFGGMTIALLTLSMSLQLEVLDGVLAASRLFGESTPMAKTNVRVALRPVIQAAGFLLFYCALIFGIVGCADFAPRLLAPGRIEHLLALPIRRWELLLGTFLGVLLLALVATFYGALGFITIIGTKAGLWLWSMLWTALVAAGCFSAIYAAMLSMTTWVRSATMSAAAGFSVLVAGVVASNREDILTVLSPGLPRQLFGAITAGLPRLATLGEAAMSVAIGERPELHTVMPQAFGMLLFGTALLVIGVWNFEARDY